MGSLAKYSYDVEFRKNNYGRGLGVVISPRHVWDGISTYIVGAVFFKWGFEIIIDVRDNSDGN